MQAVNETDSPFEIFFPDYMQRVSEIESLNRKFAYCTTVATAKKIIENREVWL